MESRDAGQDPRVLLSLTGLGAGRVRRHRGGIDSGRTGKPWGVRTARWGAVALVPVLAACGGGSDDEATADTTETTMATTVATVPYGPDDSAAWCSDFADAVLALAEVDDVDMSAQETVDRVDAVIAVARTGPGLEIPEITTLSETVTGTLPTAQAWIDAANQLYELCVTRLG
jgi:hypothetical protein